MAGWMSNIEANIGNWPDFELLGSSALFGPGDVASQMADGLLHPRLMLLTLGHSDDPDMLMPKIVAARPR